eukprot:139625-Amphidinium_carterae.2
MGSMDRVFCCYFRQLNNGWFIVHLNDGMSKPILHDEHQLCVLMSRIAPLRDVEIAMQSPVIVSMQVTASQDCVHLPLLHCRDV